MVKGRGVEGVKEMTREEAYVKEKNKNLDSYGYTERPSKEVKIPTPNNTGRMSTKSPNYSIKIDFPANTVLLSEDRGQKRPILIIRKEHRC